MTVMTREVFDRKFDAMLPAQNAKELWWLVEKLNVLQPSSCLEVGGGATSFFWGYVAPTVSLTIGNYCASELPHVPQRCLEFEEYFGYHENPEYTPGTRTFTCDSHRPETLDAVAALGPYDFLFIDGDHRRIGIEKDIEMYMPLINSGGIIAFHDWNHMGNYPTFRDWEHEGPYPSNMEWDPPCYPVQEACKNLGLITEAKIDGPHAYGIAMAYIS